MKDVLYLNNRYHIYSLTAHRRASIKNIMSIPNITPLNITKYCDTNENNVYSLICIVIVLEFHSSFF